MSIDSNKIFFSPEIASSIGLEEAIILNFIERNSPGLNEKNLVIKLSFIPNKDIDKALTKLLALELISKVNSEFILKIQFWQKYYFLYLHWDESQSLKIFYLNK